MVLGVVAVCIMIGVGFVDCRVGGFVLGLGRGFLYENRVVTELVLLLGELELDFLVGAA